MEKILNIIDSISHEKGLNFAEVEEAIKEVLVSTAKKVIDENIDFEAHIDRENKKVQLYQVITVVEYRDEATETDSFISLKEAKEIDNDFEVGDEIKYDLELEKFGRTAAAILQKELENKIGWLIQNKMFSKFKEKMGKIVIGDVAYIDDNGNTYVEIDELRAVLPKKNRIKGEMLTVGKPVKAILKYAKMTREGILLELSRTTPKFLTELLNSEVPEIKEDNVEIVDAVRIPGVRAKIALTSISEDIDAIGATVGVGGNRINAVSSEINSENIDCIEYSNVDEIFIARALLPAIVTSVHIVKNETLEEGEPYDPQDPPKIAQVIVHSDQKAKAIGKKGVNITLASMLTGYKINLVEKEDLNSKVSRLEENDEAVAQSAADVLSNLFKD